MIIPWAILRNVKSIINKPKVDSTTEMIECQEPKSSIDFDVTKNTIYIYGEIVNNDGILFEDILNILKEDTYLDIEGNEIEKEPLTELRIHLNSYGGSLQATLSILAQLEELKLDGISIKTVAKENCMSGACMILMHGDKGKRVARKYTNIMFHPALFSPNTIDGSLSIQDIRELQKTSDYYWGIMKDMLKSQTKLTDKEINAMYKYCKDYYMTVDEALEKGFIDEIL